MRKKALSAAALAVSLVCVTGTLGGCSEERTLYTYTEGVHYSNQIEEEKDGTYDKGLFYKNAPDNQTPGVPDPSLLYVDNEDSELNGQYLLFGTNSTTEFYTYKSKDLVNWTFCSVAFIPNAASWGRRTMWAPEAIYDAETDLYYLFYSASNMAIMDAGLAPSSYDACMLNVAVSESPEGPYLEYNEYKLRKEKEVAGETVTAEELAQALSAPAYDDQKLLEAVPEEAKEDCNYFFAIDPSPFVAPDGTKYLYFARDREGKVQHTWVWVMQMQDWATPAVDENGKVILRQCTSEDNGGYEKSDNRINEGPQMTLHNGKYYLQFSVNSYETSSYCVGIAVGDSPLGPFRKLTTEEGGLFIYSADNGKVSGAGHHYMLSVNGEMYALYHRHRDIAAAGADRVPAIDSVGWVSVRQSDGTMLEVPHLNGPSTTLQLAPTSAYRNIAGQAELKVSEGSNPEALTDGLIPVHMGMQPWISQYELTGKSATITFTFEDYRTVAGIMLFNSIDYESSFEKISRIRMDCMIGDEKAYVDINDLMFDPEYYEGERMTAAAAAIAAFEDLQVKSVEITFKSLYSDQEMLAISEIYILGK